MLKELRTVLRLRPVQIVNRLTRRLPRSPRFPKAAARARVGYWVEPVVYEPAPLTVPSRLRDYTEHYHPRPELELVERWIRENPAGRGAGWEPYPLSRRIVNWIKWMMGGGLATRSVSESLAAQADYLSRTMEHHLLANHLFANAKAMVFAGCFFEGGAWLGEGLRLLEREIPEQILADGGHFERSPMYHSLIFEDVLDLVNLGRAYPGLLPDWSGVAAPMSGWLKQMLHPDGQIAFFNDSALGVAPEPRLLFDYAARLGIEAVDVQLAESGYIRLENGATVVLFDAGPIGPDYQPGHAHADTLSFELSRAGRRVLVNSGISTYEDNAERHAQRGTAAHNTVRVDGQDQSEVWAAFRVARRARPLNVRTDHRSFAEAGHDGYTRLKDPVIHARRLDLGERQLTITDTLLAKREHRAEIYFHLHPEAEAKIQLDPKLTRVEESTLWYPEFDKSERNKTVVGRWAGKCPVQFTTRIQLC
jgi:uncharacterized heparinase superfamily protein